jgi:hypothetical protein
MLVAFVTVQPTAVLTATVNAYWPHGQIGFNGPASQRALDALHRGGSAMASECLNFVNRVFAFYLIGMACAELTDEEACQETCAFKAPPGLLTSWFHHHDLVGLELSQLFS